MIKQHHIWCNLQQGSPETCSQCIRLNEKFPQNNDSELDLIAKHFPNVKVLNHDSEKKNNYDND
jgi:hypothetical protein